MMLSSPSVPTAHTGRTKAKVKRNPFIVVSCVCESVLSTVSGQGPITSWNILFPGLDDTA